MTEAELQDMETQVNTWMALYTAPSVGFAKWVPALLAHIRAVEAEAEQAAQPQWWPIETHSKNADEVLLYFENGDIELGWWRDDAGAWENCDIGWFKEPPTHYMPLPEPPSKETV